LGRWAYQWVPAPGTSVWTDPEKKFFHAIVVHMIRKTFANIRLRMQATKVNFSTTFSLEFDIGWALEQHKHWTVWVTKLPPGSNPHTLLSQVVTDSRTVFLETADLLDYYTCDAALKCNLVNAIPHEFVHTLGQNRDEYWQDSPHLHDKQSILNLGTRLRERHLHMILKCLAEMVPDARFSMA
jgi:hypothetical protein